MGPIDPPLSGQQTGPQMLPVVQNMANRKVTVNLFKKYSAQITVLLSDHSWSTRELTDKMPNWAFQRIGPWPILSSSRDVRLYTYMFPSHAIFFEASHWPSDHMTRSRPLIGQSSFPTIWWWWGGGQGSGSCV